VGALAVVVLTAGFWRGWQLEEYALFRADQARDAYLAKDVLDNGWGHFKLLGPKAGASVIIDDIESAFKLGPVYHYFQYIGVGLLGEANIFALLLVDWILSLASIGLFYILLRNFFNKKISLLTTILFAFSYILTVYSRFAWNINQIVFWELLVSVSILKVLMGIKNKNNCNEWILKQKQRCWWFLMMIFSLVVVSQLHILSAIVFAFIFGVMFLIYRPRINWHCWFGGIIIILVLYAPMIISDVYNQGDNFKRLLTASSAEKVAEGTFGKKIWKLSQFHGKNYMLILTGINKYDYKKIAIVGDWFIILTLILLRISLFQKELLGVREIRKKIRQIFTSRERKYMIKRALKINSRQKRFLIVVSLWFFIFMIMYFRILPRLHKERYWLLIAPLPFIFMAFWFYLIDRLGVFYNKYIANGVIGIIFIFILFSNLTATINFYKSLEKGDLVASKYHQKIILGPYRFFTGYGEMKRIVDYMSASVVDGQASALCFKSMEYQNKLGFEYLLDVHYPKIKYEQTSDGKDYDCVFYVITKTSREDRELKDFKLDYEIGDKKTFKSLTVWELKVKNNKIKKQEVLLKQKVNNKDGRVIYWKDLFNK